MGSVVRVFNVSQVSLKNVLGQTRYPLLAGSQPPTAPPQARARDVDDRAAGLRAADQLRLPPHAEGAYSIQKLLGQGISPLVRMI